VAQKLLTKDRGWPVPSKFAHVYENLLSNCPYQVSMLKKLFSLTRPNKLECFVTGNHGPLKSNICSSLLGLVKEKSLIQHWHLMFFDAESLCHSDNEKNVTKLLEKQGQEAVDFFNVTFRGSSRIGQRNLHYKTLLCVKCLKQNQSSFSPNWK